MLHSLPHPPADKKIYCSSVQLGVVSFQVVSMNLPLELQPITVPRATVSPIAYFAVQFGSVSFFRCSSISAVAHQATAGIERETLRPRYSLTTTPCSSNLDSLPKLYCNINDYTPAPLNFLTSTPCYFDCSKCNFAPTICVDLEINKFKSS